MKKIISLLLALVLAAFAVACGGPDKAASPDDDAPSGQTDTSGGSGGGSSILPASITPAESFTAYSTAKSALTTKITDALTNNPGTELTSLVLLGVVMVDLAMLPATCFGAGQVAAETALGFMGATNVSYSESGNSYTVTYTDEEGQSYEFKGTYDAAADALTCSASADGVESLYSEYRKTSYGYAGQSFLLSDDGTAVVYKIATQGEDGFIGITESASKPSALTGGEAADFPKTCEQWYGITGGIITGLTGDGEPLNFPYVPSPTT